MRFPALPCALLLLAQCALVASNTDAAPTALKLSVDASLELYRNSEAEAGTAPVNPAGIYAAVGEVHGSPQYSRVDGSASHLYRSSKGIWVITNNTANFEKNRGSFITKVTGESPIGLMWRCVGQHYHFSGPLLLFTPLLVTHVCSGVI